LKTITGTGIHAPTAAQAPRHGHCERSAFTVIERTLAWGDLPELRWLFARYGRERLAEWVRQAGWRCLPRRRLKYWLSFFGLSDRQRGERIWPH
jgi:hypothetical protein